MELGADDNKAFGLFLNEGVRPSNSLENDQSKAPRHLALPSACNYNGSFGNLLNKSPWS